jgi:histidyl-tRNA synthetase
MAKEHFQSPRGTYDILPDEAKYWQTLEKVTSEECSAFGFGRIEVPMFEQKGLYIRSTGATTDIVEKEMFGVSRLTKIEKEKEEELVLRPEFTPGIIRAYLEHGMTALPQPVRLWTSGSVFRYSRPQRLRFREFRQVDYEVIGDASPYADATVIFLTWAIMQRLGLSEYLILDINSVGDKKCRPKIRKALIDYFSQKRHKLGADDRRRLEENPLRILDSKDPESQETIKGAPNLLDLLCPECKAHFQSVLEQLDELAIPYNLEPRLVRGLDYYTRTAFEVRRTDDTTRQSSLGGGGRFDYLVEELGGRSTPATGCALGVERIIDLMKEKQVEVTEGKGPTAYVVSIGESAQKRCLPLVSELKKAGLAVGCSISKGGLAEQLGAAERMGVRFVLIMGEKEIREGTVLLKDMQEGSQEPVLVKNLSRILREKTS